MSTRYYKVESHYEDSTRNHVTYHKADGPKAVLSAVGITLAEGERASFKKQYFWTNDATISYRQISKAEFDKGVEARVAEAVKTLTALGQFSNAVATKSANVYKSGNVKPAPRPVPPAGRRSKSAFGVVRHAAL